MTIYVSSPWYLMMEDRIKANDVNFLSERDIWFPVDIKADPDSYLISALLPGVKTEDLNITVVNETVSIQGTINHDRNQEENYLLAERPCGRFYRSLTLPVILNSLKAEAELKDGILTLRIPKADEARPNTIKVISKEK